MAGEVTTKTYKAGEVVFKRADFPLQSFFLVRKGSVDLKKDINVEQTNFICTGKQEYYRRVKANQVAHILGTVEIGNYFGLLESLTNATEGSINC